MQKARCHPLKRTPTAFKHTVSGSVSLPFLGFFSPFPHGTSSLSVSSEYLALDDGPPRFKQDFTCPVLLRKVLWLEFFFNYRAITFYGCPFQNILLKNSYSIC